MLNFMQTFSTVKSPSIGKYSTFVHIASSNKLTYTVFNQEQILLWKPLLDYLK